MLHVRRQSLGQTDLLSACLSACVDSATDYSTCAQTCRDSYTASAALQTTPAVSVTTAPAATPASSNALLAASLLNQGRPGYPGYPGQQLYPQTTNINQYLPIILGGAALLAVVMVMK